MTIIAEGQIIAEKLRLERPLARGGMGSVWVAHHLKLDTPVAVKFMEPALAASETARGRFEREARAAAQIKSPHVVQVHDYGVDGDTPYIVMELLRGEDLAARLDKLSRVSLAEATRVALPITKALRRAHELGLVHRDLKPGNIFLAQEGDEETVKILDFGIAKAVTPNSPQSGDVTRSGHLIGSPLYMSPEQIRKSKEVDHRSDLWSLGVILYQMLTGRPPFVEDEVGAVLVAICTDPIAPPSQIVPSLGPRVDRFFETALARDPARRFQSAKEMFDALDALSTNGLTANDLAKKNPTGKRDAALEATVDASAQKAELGLAETLPVAEGNGTITMSPSGRTHDATVETQWKNHTRRFAAAAVVVFGAASWFWFGRANDAREARDDGPGSPTLPLPPPVTDPTESAAALPPPAPPAPPAPPSPAVSVGNVEEPASALALVSPRGGKVQGTPSKPAATDHNKPAETAGVKPAEAQATDDDELGFGAPRAQPKNK